MKKYQMGSVFLFIAALMLAVAIYHIIFGTMRTGWIFAAIGTVCVILFYKKG